MRFNYPRFLLIYAIITIIAKATAAAAAIAMPMRFSFILSFVEITASAVVGSSSEVSTSALPTVRVESAASVVDSGVPVAVVELFMVAALLVAAAVVFDFVVVVEDFFVVEVFLVVVAFLVVESAVELSEKSIDIWSVSQGSFAYAIKLKDIDAMRMIDNTDNTFFIFFALLLYFLFLNLIPSP